tara:strand:- start:940 stop:1110 length:171 start_codon:yes stop_codon:yes gene_type:complete
LGQADLSNGGFQKVLLEGSVLSAANEEDAKATVSKNPDATASNILSLMECSYVSRT